MKSIINDMVAAIKSMNMNVYSITEILDGKAQTIRLREDSRCRNLYSVSKAYTMAAVGFLFDEGRLKPEDTVADIFGGLPDGSNERWNEVTVHDALRHTMGLKQDEDVHLDLDIDNDNTLTFAPDDWLTYMFSLPLAGVRGVDFQYTDTAFYLLSRVVSQITGRSLFDYLREKLFAPLGFKEYSWSTCPYGYSAGGSGLYVSCEDMAKLGKLWLDYGICNGKRIISEEWVKLAVENEYAFGLRDEKYRGFYKSGLKSQLLYFSYEQSLVLAIQSYAPSIQMAQLIDLFL